MSTLYRIIGLKLSARSIIELYTRLDFYYTTGLFEPRPSFDDNPEYVPCAYEFAMSARPKLALPPYRRRLESLLERLVGGRVDVEIVDIERTPNAPGPGDTFIALYCRGVNPRGEEPLEFDEMTFGDLRSALGIASTGLQEYVVAPDKPVREIPFPPELALHFHKRQSSSSVDTST